ncbi:hypothetical protein PU02_1197 [Bartonella ancashensis]|uniref:Uncharacterized protein n=1 Tax=Bartonella ancashensis TaxID=1318743 RepID=A0A0M3T355_9HYPH|nr:hypothetical protein PU02_1197 [Bartonella ancashensis]
MQHIKCDKNRQEKSCNLKIACFNEITCKAELEWGWIGL